MDRSPGEVAISGSSPGLSSILYLHAGSSSISTAHRSNRMQEQ